MKKILLDTNMLIYLEDDNDNIVNKDVAELTRRLYDSCEYKIVIHPKSITESLKIKDKRKRDIFQSKIGIYKKIEDPPLATDEFQMLAGFSNENDKIDNELLYAIKQHCASFLITNDIRLKRKSVKIGMGDKVLGIQEALEYFKEKPKSINDIPIFIREELENISRKDSLVILFKHYITFEKPIDLGYLQEKGIIKGNIQRPRSIENKSIVDILNYSKKDYSKIEVS